MREIASGRRDNAGYRADYYAGQMSRRANGVRCFMIKIDDNLWKKIDQAAFTAQQARSTFARNVLNRVLSDPELTSRVLRRDE